MALLAAVAPVQAAAASRAAALLAWAALVAAAKLVASWCLVLFSARAGMEVGRRGLHLRVWTAVTLPVRAAATRCGAPSRLSGVAAAAHGGSES